MKTASRMCHSSLFELLCSFCAPIVLFLAILKWLLLCADKRNHFSLKFENVYYVPFHAKGASTAEAKALVRRKRSW